MMQNSYIAQNFMILVTNVFFQLVLPALYLLALLVQI